MPHPFRLLAMLLCATAVLTACPAAASSWSDKVDPWVLDELVLSPSGESEFLIVLAEQAELSGAARLSTQARQGELCLRAAARDRGAHPGAAPRRAGACRRRPSPVLDRQSGLGERRRRGHRVDRRTRRRRTHRGESAGRRVRTQRSGRPRTELTRRRRPNPAVVRVEHRPGQRAAGLGPGLPGPGRGGRRPGHRLPVGPSGAQESVPRLERRDRQPQLQLARRDPHRRRQLRRQLARPRATTAGHGTHTMGTMVGDDGARRTRSAWRRARSGSAAATWTRASARPATYTECFQWFIAPTDLNNQNPDPAKAPDVINNSWGCPVSEGCDVNATNALQLVVENVRAAGIVPVASAGNGGPACATVNTPPATYDSSFTVGATSTTERIAGFSSRGPVTVDGSNRMKPDIAAPGRERPLVDSVATATACWSGTSMAEPHVAGLVALLLSADPLLAGNVDRIEELVRRSAVHQIGGLRGLRRRRGERLSEQRLRRRQDRRAGDDPVVHPVSRRLRDRHDGRLVGCRPLKGSRLSGYCGASGAAPA